MEHITLTVFFEEPFWVGVFERVENGQLSVCKHTFGAEPTNAEVLAFIRQHFRTLAFSPAVAAATAPRHTNPKRRQRQAKSAANAHGIGTKAQQALAAQREAGKKAHRRAQRDARQAKEAERYAKRRAKQKAKHRGH